ncbi:MAG: rod shape-determining protein MreC [Betaproteobacteria bacterium]|nr:rod shape-determining protein MreC [Betaproteobacteria bacterium]
MRPIPAEPPPFFRRGPSALARVTFFGLASIVLLFVDARFRYLEDVRQAAGAILFPLQRLVRVPGEALDSVAAYFASKRDLERENERLRSELIAQSPAAQGYVPARDENARLKALVDLKATHAEGSTVVQVLYAGRDPFAQKVFVSRGREAGLVPGSAVIDEHGVVGQLTRVHPTMSEVTLVTDKDHAVPVKAERSGVRSVLYGAGTGRAPELRFTPPSADIRVGDRLVTSGLDGTYPPGLAVAQVTSVERETGQMFARIECAPLGGVDRSETLLVLAPPAALPPRPEEPSEAEAARKGGRAKARRGG